MQDLPSPTAALRRSLGRYLLLAGLLAAAPLAALAQTGGVGIGTTTPNASAILDVSSTSKGLLPPRLTQAQRDAINPAATAAGLVIFNTSTNKLNSWNGTRWEEVASGTAVVSTGQTVTFGYTGAPQTYIVPRGVTTLTVDAAGAVGSSQSDNNPGLGARVQATLTVTPGETLTLYVGGGGGNVAGGYNGGGNGSSSGRGGGGGGASDVRRSATAPSTSLADRLLVAAGGGGCGTFCDGGGGGAPNGAAGAGYNAGTGGSGATQTAGGSVGGALGQGGNAEPGNSGGGGGGYYGGGGGSGGYAAGGGGSSWVTPTGSTAVVMTAGYQGGDGYIKLTTPGGSYPGPALDGSNFVNVPGTWTEAGGNVYRTTGSVSIGTSIPAAKLMVQPASDAEMGLRVTNGVADGPALSGNIVLQPLTGGNSGFAFLGFNGSNANGETRYSTSKNRWRLGVDQRINTDAFFLDTYNGTIVSVLRATTAGDVGIGTTGDPTQRLEVAGGIKFTGTGSVLTFPNGTTQATAASGTSFIQNQTAQQASSNFNVSGSGTVGGLLTAGSATVSGNAVVAGTLGLGTSAPAGGLHVLTGNGGVASGTGAVLSGPPTGNPNLELRGGATAVTPYIDFAETSGVDYTTRLRSISGVLNVEGGGSGGLLLRVNGSIQASNVTFTSDARFKTNVRPLTSALASVLALRGVRYEWNALGVAHGGTAGAGQVGLLAQELEKVYPELVSTDAEGYKAVNYAQLTPVLIEALKEQQQQIEALKAEAAAAKTAAGAATSRAASAEAKAAQATATLETFEARLRRLEAAGGQAQR